MDAEPQLTTPRRHLVRGGLIAAGLAMAGLGTWTLWPKHAAPPPPPPAAVLTEQLPPAPALKESKAVVKSGDNVAGFVARTGVSAADAKGLVAALLSVRSPRSLRPGNTLTVWQDPAGRITKAAFEASLTDAIDFNPVPTGFQAQKREVKLDTEVASVSVDVRSSLYDAFLDAHEDPGLAVSVSDVLAWEVDFYRDVQPGDRIDVLVEKTTHDGKLVKYGNIVAVRYAGQIGTKELFRYATKDSVSYYDETGRSARRPFLKAPLPFVHITSRFGGRMHPILGYYKAHQGVDYGAPKGTPVWAVGDGVVEWAGMKGGNGNLISIRHSNGFTSHYAHLSKYAAGIHRGARVSQKQVIGYVGATGLATGPHLHFAFSQGGKFVNPLNQKFPAGDPIPAKERDAYLQAIAPLKLRLEHSQLVATARP